MYKTAKVENLFGDADDISSVSSHEEGDRGEADMVCRNFTLVMCLYSLFHELTDLDLVSSMHFCILGSSFSPLQVIHRNVLRLLSMKC